MFIGRRRRPSISDSECYSVRHKLRVCNGIRFLLSLPTLAAKIWSNSVSIFEQFSNSNGTNQAIPPSSIPIKEKIDQKLISNEIKDELGIWLNPSSINIPAKLQRSIKKESCDFSNYVGPHRGSGY
ncbi:hypothetical protein ACHQM5_023657 [Ranunculus cassubicifolius]